MKETFEYLVEKFGVKLIENSEFNVRNNHSTIYAARNYLRNTYICSADNYFLHNPFEKVVDNAYYAAVFMNGTTEEWCISYDKDDVITDITIGGCEDWVMLGHSFWTKDFSEKFCSILESEYQKEETVGKFWENVYIDHIDELKLKIRKYPGNYIYEFDSLDELRVFDESYCDDTQSDIIKKITKELGCKENQLTDFNPMKNNEGDVVGFTFDVKSKRYLYMYEKGIIYDK